MTAVVLSIIHHIGSPEQLHYFSMANRPNCWRRMGGKRRGNIRLLDVAWFPWLKLPSGKISYWTIPGRLIGPGLGARILTPSIFLHERIDLANATFCPVPAEFLPLPRSSIDATQKSRQLERVSISTDIERGAAPRVFILCPKNPLLLDPGASSECLDGKKKKASNIEVYPGPGLGASKAPTDDWTTWRCQQKGPGRFSPPRPNSSSAE